MELEIPSFRQNSCGQIIVDAKKEDIKQTGQTSGWENKRGTNNLWTPCLGNATYYDRSQIANCICREQILVAYCTYEFHLSLQLDAIESIHFI